LKRNPTAPQDIRQAHHFRAWSKVVKILSILEDGSRQIQALLSRSTDIFWMMNAMYVHAVMPEGVPKDLWKVQRLFGDIN
jgi:hypothetical protein